LEVADPSIAASRERPQHMSHKQRRPAGIVVLSLFFVIGTLASGLTVVLLILPGTSLDMLWRLNPHARGGFDTIGHSAVFLMSAVCLACCSAVLGLWRLRRWGLWTAISILSVNLLGDILNAFLLWDWRTLVGLPIAGLMIAYLLRNRTIFER
jgi:uncharacterized membrane protein (DUF2068 family)